MVVDVGCVGANEISGSGYEVAPSGVGRQAVCPRTIEVAIDRLLEVELPSTLERRSLCIGDSIGRLRGLDREGESME